MIYYFDTSALIKRYILEQGSNKVDNLFESAEAIFVSAITKIESISTIKRLLSEKVISQEEYTRLKNEIIYDFNYFSIISLNSTIEKQAINLIETYQLKTLDSIQLACFISIRDQVNAIVLSDKKLEIAARQENFDIINPTKSSH
mgnify:CR=1 FL=1